MNKLIRIIALLLVWLIFITPFYDISLKAENFKIGYIFETNVNIRADASINSKSVFKVSNLTVQVIDEKNDVDSAKNPLTNKIYKWYNISFDSKDGKILGYVREDLISISSVSEKINFEEQLKAFPKSYHKYLEELHKKYPNWQFVADEVPSGFFEAVSAQDYLFYKLTQSSYNSWRSMRKGCYDWSKGSFVKTDNGTWYGASREVISYYMDPRNFLNENNIYIFMKQSFDVTKQTVSGVENIVKGTFLDAKISDTNDINNGKRYAEVIFNAGSQSKVNAYVLASTLLQEQGVNGTTLTRGVDYNNKKVFNFFNFGATGGDKNEVLYNAKKYAYNQGWFSATDSIVKGAIKFGQEYIAKGQDTYFYKNYNVLQPNNLWHQYAQNVSDSVNTATFLKSAYINKTDMNLVFRIPVYKSLPTAVCELPQKSDKLNNYYFSDIKADGLTPSFNRYIYEYSLLVEDDSKVMLEAPKGASIVSERLFSLKKGSNIIELIVKSETGYTNTYKINVDALKSCKLYINSDIEETPKEEITVVKKGDTNGDGNITTSDLANVRLHLLEIINLKGDYLKAADTNNDSNITTSDLANIRLHLLELITLK